jgi:hypothetical protein
MEGRVCGVDGRRTVRTAERVSSVPLYSAERPKSEIWAGTQARTHASTQMHGHVRQDPFIDTAAGAHHASTRGWRIPACVRVYVHVNVCVCVADLEVALLVQQQVLGLEV